MATTFDVIFLGISTTDIDPTEGNTTSENVGLLVGSTFGGLENPLFGNIQSLSPVGSPGTQYEVGTNADQFSVDGITRTLDGYGVYIATITYVDGTTASVTAKIAQTTTGELYLLPEIAGRESIQAVLEAGPIQSITLNSLTTQGTGVTVDRLASDFDDAYTDSDAGSFITIGSSDADGTIVTTAADVIDGAGGDDDIRAGGGNDTVYGGTGADFIDADLDDDVVFGGAGNDDLRGGDGNDWIDGGTESDFIDGGAGNDTLLGGVGDDDLRGGGGLDVILAGEGNDFVAAGTETDTVFGGSGQDSIQGNDGDDFLYAGAGNDTVSGDLGADLIWGNGGNDSLSGLDGNDTIHGGAPPAAAVTIVNGDFSNGLTGWTTTGPGAANYNGTGSFNSFDGQVGDTFAQTITTQTGQAYQLSFTAAEFSTGVGDHTIRAEILDANGNVIATSTQTIADGSSQTLTLDFTSTTDAVTIRFTNTASTGTVVTDLQIDNVAVTPAPTLETDDDTISGGIGDDLIFGGAGNDTFVYNAGDGLDTISDFNVGATGTLSDGDATNNDFIDLSAFFDTIAELHDDYDDDGILNQSNAGNIVWGQTVDYSNNAQFGAGQGIVFDGQTPDANSFTVENTNVVCFAEDTLILTPSGQVPISQLQVGDRVVTRDNGTKPILWIGRRHLDQATLAANPHLHPVQLKAAFFGLDRDLVVSPQHGVLLHHDLRGGSEILYRATHLAQLPGGGARVMLGRRTITYHHILFDRHEVVFANGMAAESLYPGPMSLGALGAPARQEMQSLFPDLGRMDVVQSYGPTARSYSRKRDLPPHLAALSLR